MPARPANSKAPESSFHAWDGSRRCPRDAADEGSDEGRGQPCVFEELKRNDLMKNELSVNPVWNGKLKKKVRGEVEVSAPHDALPLGKKSGLQCCQSRGHYAPRECSR